jgi:hypothetical protein
MRLAAAITCATSGLPPISWSTLGRCDLRRVPLPAAMITTASFIFDSTSQLLKEWTFGRNKADFHPIFSFQRAKRQSALTLPSYCS